MASNHRRGPIDIVESRQQSLAGNKSKSLVDAADAERQNRDEINMHCAKCDRLLVWHRNDKWTQITNSYFVIGDLAAQDQSQYAMEPKGPSQQPGGSNRSFEGCLIQPLACPSCHDTVAFQCIEAQPPKLIYKDRIFYKFAKIAFKNISSERIMPVVEPVPSDIAISGDTSSATTASPLARASPAQRVSPPTTKLSKADKEAVQSTNDESLDWQEAHENWTRATRTTLSPAAFAKRILKLGGGLKTKPIRVPVQQSDADLPPPSRNPAPNPNVSQSSSVYSRSDFATPSTLAAASRPSGTQFELPQATRRAHAPGMQSDSLERQREDINVIKGQLTTLQQSVHALHDAITDLNRRGADDYESINLITETVNTQTSGVNNLRLAVVGLKERVRRLEGSVADPKPPPATLNTLRDDLSDHSVQSSQKRRRLSGSFSVDDLVSTQSQNPQDLSHSQTPIIASRPQYQNVSTQNADSQASWRPRGGSIRGIGPRKRGRPRKVDQNTNVDELGTPPWEHDSWQGPPGSQEDSYYNFAPLSTPNSTDRGRIIRRGTGGGVFESAKKTRQKPIRNAEGVLIRRDGKPDQRSLSSAQNLKRTQTMRRRLQHEGQSPTAHPPRSEMDTAKEIDATKGTDTLRHPEPSSTAPNGERRTSVMNQMFPNGVSEDSRRLNHAETLFAPGRSPEREKMLPRKDMQREELTDRHDTNIDTNLTESNVESGVEIPETQPEMAQDNTAADG